MEVTGFDLKIARLRKKARQWDVAARCGMSQTKLSLIESGRVTPQPAELAALREALGLDGNE